MISLQRKNLKSPMSARGHDRHFRARVGTSALPPLATELLH
jgi:hypothetical protein